MHIKSYHGLEKRRSSVLDYSNGTVVVLALHISVIYSVTCSAAAEEVEPGV